MREGVERKRSALAQLNIAVVKKPLCIAASGFFF